MDNENEFDLSENNSEEIINRKDKKIHSLSEKLGLTEKEKMEASSKAEAEAQARAEAEKERDFFKGFNTLSSKYQGASDHQEQIWEKVKGGYELEDATIAILAKEGKYTSPVQPEARINIAGGSASTGITDTIEKPLNQRSRDEMRGELLDLESKGEFFL